MAGHPSANGARPRRWRPADTSHALLGTALIAGLMLSASPAQSSPMAAAETDAAIEALVASATQACRSALASRYSADQSNLDLWLTPGLRIAIEGGQLDLAALRREGLQFGWLLRGRPAPAPIGLCRTRGDGTVIAIEEQND